MSWERIVRGDITRSKRWLYNQKLVGMAESQALQNIPLGQPQKEQEKLKGTSPKEEEDKAAGKSEQKKVLEPSLVQDDATAEETEKHFKLQLLQDMAAEHPMQREQNANLVEETPDLKEQALEADEINQLFDDFVMHKGGFCLQLVLSLSVLFFVLIDTVNVASIRGNWRQVDYLTDTRFVEYLDYKERLANKASNSTLKLEQTLFESFLHSASFEPTLEEREQGDADESAIAEARYGRVLRSVTSASDFYIWLKYMLHMMYGPHADLHDYLEKYERVEALHKSLDVDASFCSRKSPDRLVQHNQKMMMNSNLMMGSRLIVKAAKKEKIESNSKFSSLYNETRTHRASTVDNRKASLDDYIDQNKFSKYSVEDGNHGQAGEFIAFFPNEMTCESVEHLYKFLLKEKIVSNDILSMTFEMMLFSADAFQGTIFKFEFFSTHSSSLKAYLRLSSLEPYNNGGKRPGAMIRVLFQFLIVLCLAIMVWDFVRSSITKCRQLVSYRLFEFTFTDFVTLVVIIFGVCILIVAGNLLYSPEYEVNKNFKLPITSHDEYARWSRQMEEQNSFRQLLGFFVMIQMVVVLRTAAYTLPSLGILFTTIEKSYVDMFTFSTIALLMISVFVIIFHISFGGHHYTFASLSDSFLSSITMFLGDIHYSSRMYGVDPEIAAITLIMFVLTMNFMVQSMYTAIVIRTYDKLQQRKIFLSEAMAILVLKRSKKKIQNLFNLLRCRSSFQKAEEDAPTKANKRQLLEGLDEKQSQEGFYQKLQHNWGKLWRSKVMTKEKFQIVLKNAAKAVSESKLEQIVERRKVLQLSDKKKTEESYFKLKQGCLLLVHLICSNVFFMMWSEIPMHSELRTVFEKKLLEDTLLTDLQLDFEQVSDRLIKMPYNQIGPNLAMGDNLRLTFRLYSMQENLDEKTNKVFEKVKVSTTTLPSAATDKGPIVLRWLKYINQWLLSTEDENKGVYQFTDNESITSNYIPPSSAFDTFQGEGGYVFKVDLKSMKMVGNGALVTYTFAEFLKQVGSREDFERQLSSLGLDWVMYNANYDCLIYCALLFTYDPMGVLKTTVEVNSLRLSPTHIQLGLLLVFALFYLYFTIKLLKDLFMYYHSTPQNAGQQPGQQGNRAEDNSEKSWFSRFTNAIGIDEQRLHGENLVVKFVLVIWMVVKKIVITTLMIIRAIWRFCRANILNFIELIITYCMSLVIITLVQLIKIQLSGQLTLKSDSLEQQMNKLMNLNMNTGFNMAVSVFCLSIRVLRLAEFSMQANLPFATLKEGSKSIVNLLIILIVFLVACALAPYAVMCQQVNEFGDLVTSFYTVLKILSGDFFVVYKMYSVSPFFTTFYLCMLMIGYTFYMTAMFLAIVVGYFEKEWGHVKAYKSSAEQTSLLSTFWRILKLYFAEKKKEESKRLYSAARLAGGKSKRTKPGCCSCPFNCTRQSFKPHGMLERVVVYCMLNWCRGTDNKRKVSEQPPDSPSQQKIASRDSKQSGERDQFKPGEQLVGDEFRNSPFDRASMAWGVPVAGNLRFADDSKLINAQRQFTQWFDGWSVGQYQQDLNKLDFIRNDKNLLQKAKSLGANLDYLRDQRLDEQKLKDFKMINNLPGLSEQVLNLEHWNDKVDDHEKANSNYWLHHLQKQVNMLSKKELDLYGLKAMDCFFTQHLTAKSIETTSLKGQLSQDQQKVFYMSENERFEFFSDPGVSVERKYLAWQAIDMVYRFTKQDEAFRRAGKEKRRYEKRKRNEPGLNEKPTHSNLMTLLIAQIERPIEEKVEKMMHDSAVINNIAKENNCKNPLKFDAIKATTWRNKEYHRVHSILQKVWRECLTEHEKFEFWFTHFNTMERVRLWNQLVFTREWFRRVVEFSLRQPNYLKAVEKDRKIKSEILNAAKQRAEKEKTLADGVEEGEDQGQPILSGKLDLSFYKGFHRKDLNDKLKAYAKKMYARGVRNKELLIIKVKADVSKEVVEGKTGNDKSSFFNPEKNAEDKHFDEKLKRYVELSQAEELSEARRIFTPDEMLKLWNQLFLGTYIQLRKKKEAKERDREDGLDNEYEIELFDDEEFGEHNQKIESAYKKYEQDRTMDRYDQIHYFFSSIIEHNVKTQKSVEKKVREAGDKGVGPEQPMLIVKNAVAAKSESEHEKMRFEQYEKVRELVIDEEERLPFWMLMQKEEKLDMLAHQCIDSEAQIMGLLIEFEYGAENNFKTEGTNLSVDNLLENALNQMIFQKYLAYTRLEATFYARKYMRELIDETQDASIKLYNFVEFLFDQNEELERQERRNTKRIKENKEKNLRIETQMKELACKSMQDLQAKKKFDEKYAEQAALRMKLLQSIED